MAIGKNKKLMKSRKGGKKKYVDPMLRKEWYEFKAPFPFEAKSFGKTCITRTTGTSKLYIKLNICNIKQELLLKE